MPFTIFKRMQTAPIPDNESERLEALQNYSILDTLPEQDFEDITKIASEICQTPISLITLIDSNRQWFKSHHGLDISETSRDYAFCAHAINTPEAIFEVKNSREDLRFADNPLVTGHPNVVFYAGVPLVNPEGFSLGTLCVIDSKPRELTEPQLQALRALSNQVVKLFEFKRINKRLEASQNEIQARNEELEKFAYVLSHDIKSPLNNIIALTALLKNDQKGKINDQGEQILNHISNSSARLKNLIDGIITHYMELNANVQIRKEIDLEEMAKELNELLNSKHEFDISYRFDSKSIEANEVALKQILTNLISNAIKYSDKPKVKIEVCGFVKGDTYHFSVKDNGPGIERTHFDKIFQPFQTLGNKDRFNNLGTGIGLATVKRVIDKLGGSIYVESEINHGTTFTFQFNK